MFINGTLRSQKPLPPKPIAAKKKGKKKAPAPVIVEEPKRPPPEVTPIKN